MIGDAKRKTTMADMIGPVVTQVTDAAKSMVFFAIVACVALVLSVAALAVATRNR